MITPSDIPSDGQPDAPARLRFLQRLVALSIKPAARGYFVQWAEAWTKARGHRSAAATTAFFDALGRSTHLYDWQFRQAVDAVRILALEILTLPWASTFDWRGLADQAWSLEPDHRTHGRESIKVGALPPDARSVLSRNGDSLPDASRAVLPSSCGVPPQALPSASRAALPSQPIQDPSVPLPEINTEVARIVEALRRAIRLEGLAYATEQTYVYWNIRFTRFCLTKLKQAPQDAGPPAITAYLDSLALECNVSTATQKQALNAMVFLTRRVFGIEDFTIETPHHCYTYRRPPVVLSRREVAAILAHLEDPWKLAAQLMFGSGLRLMECLRLRAKDLDFDQGTITVHDGKGGKHRVVPLPVALEERLKDHLAKARSKHLKDLAVGAGEVHMPESLLRKWPSASREWSWQYIFASATLCPHPQTGRVARHHLHEASMQRQFKDAVAKTDIAKRATCHTLRHSFASCLLQSGTDIRTVQDLLGHADVSTTMIYLHVIKRPGAGGPSPLDIP